MVEYEKIPAPLRPDYDADDYGPKDLLDAIQWLLNGLATCDVFETNDLGIDLEGQSET